MSKDIKEITNEIINKKFNKSRMGYNPDEVDDFLDYISNNFSNFINKYEALENNYHELENKYKDATKRNNELEIKCGLLQTQIDRLESSGHSFSILNDRINRLEEKEENKNDDKGKK